MKFLKQQKKITKRISKINEIFPRNSIKVTEKFPKNKNDKKVSWFLTFWLISSI